MDTHGYDGKWRAEYEEIIRAHSITDVPVAFPNIRIPIHLATCDPSVIANAQKYEKILLNTNDAQNYDSINNVNATELLHRIAHILETRLQMQDRIPTMTADEIEQVKKMYVIENVNIDVIRACNISMINGIVEQMADISNGACSQGRSTRLFQIYKTFF